MVSRARGALAATQRVRQMEVDDAKRTLSDAQYLSHAMRRNSEKIRARAAALDAHELGVLMALGPLDVRAMTGSRGYRRLVQSELDAAAKAEESAERTEADARNALAAAVRARDAVSRLQDRRHIEERAVAGQRDQHALDDHGAILAVMESFQDPRSGDVHGS